MKLFKSNYMGDWLSLDFGNKLEIKRMVFDN